VWSSTLSLFGCPLARHILQTQQLIGQNGQFGVIPFQGEHSIIVPGDERDQGDDFAGQFGLGGRLARGEPEP
jgi:hypothetical protein